MAEDPGQPGGAAEMLLNLDHVMWIAPHPEDKRKSVAKLTGEGNALILLAPVGEIRHEVTLHDA
jgi:hypothetical protein